MTLSKQQEEERQSVSGRGCEALERRERFHGPVCVSGGGGEGREPPGGRAWPLELGLS